MSAIQWLLQAFLYISTVGPFLCKILLERGFNVGGLCYAVIGWLTETKITEPIKLQNTASVFPTAIKASVLTVCANTFLSEIYE